MSKREILFRGKRIDNGEWVEGYYAELPVGSLAATIFSNDDEIVCEDTASYIIKVFAKQHSNYSNSTPLQVIECEKYEVIPETVGRYTGLTDKNGTKIFEGDIVQSCASENEKDWKIWIVDFNDGCFCFKSNSYVLKNRRKFRYETNLLCEDEISFYGLVVIGNIHDNPELLEQED